MLKKIGIFGGTFNPVHTGHLILAQDALERFGLDRVLFIPCAHPPHKKPNCLAPASHRLGMLKAALKDDSRFAISDMEIKRGGVSYSIDTLRELRRMFPTSVLYFIVGADSLNELRSWRKVGELQKLCIFIAMGRPGYAVRGSSKVMLFKGHLVDISSSEIRKRIAEGRRIRHLVPKAVERYINSRRLYQSKELSRSKRSN